MHKWFSKRDLEELTAKGFTISEFEVVGHKKVSDFEYIFTRDNIINRTYLKVSDIYPQEQSESSKGKFVFPNFLYARTVDNKTIDVSYAPQSLDAVEYIKNDHTEQPEVDLKEEIASFFSKNPIPYEHITDWPLLKNTAIHFYELGKLNAKKGVMI